ncbi:FAD dependent oxidoreductase family protein [Oryzomicrobium terrae]|uniref:FAD dependent oxidoreductase family protein n=1 Tax=Oryzomicrobium terrae TaxID=1735038 RepID=A0A5C1E9V0_9RHOO|nr:FAD-binding oxidoreductase [Oryzomicrobium terrae]QEL65465.1 FAD dependent oxidoreductase family protein [Oryzomicrobium terrae]
MPALTTPSLPSLWSATATPPPPTQPLDHDAVADVAIIGAGYAGLSAALHLAEAGRHAVVLEAVEIGHGGAGRNNGMVIPALTRAYPADLRARFGIVRGDRLARLVAGSAAFTFDLIRRHQIACDAVQTGWTQPAHSPGRARLARDRFEQWQALGADVAYLDRNETATLSGSPLYHGAWLARSGGHVNPLKLVRGLAGAAQAAGATIHTQSPVTAVARDGEGWRLATPSGSLRAAKVIVATDAYSDNLFPQLRRSIVPVRFFQLATAPLPEAVRRQVLPGCQALSDTHADMYFVRPTVDGRLVSGGALVLNHRWQPRLARHVAGRLARMFPALGPSVSFDYAWDGHVAITTDFLPRLHELAPGIVTVAGYNGRGVALATASGKVLADAVLAGGSSADLADLDIPLTPLAPIPLHGALTRVASLELLRYRWRDTQEVAA